jgi:hypothetical protein
MRSGQGKQQTAAVTVRTLSRRPIGGCRQLPARGPLCRWEGAGRSSETYLRSIVSSSVELTNPAAVPGANKAGGGEAALPAAGLAMLAAASPHDVTAPRIGCKQESRRTGLLSVRRLAVRWHTTSEPNILGSGATAASRRCTRATSPATGELRPAAGPIGVCWVTRPTRGRLYPAIRERQGRKRKEAPRLRGSHCRGLMVYAGRTADTTGL